MNLKDCLYKCSISRDVIFYMADRKRITYEKGLAPKKCVGGTLHNKKDIYLIRWTNPAAGLFAYVLNILGELWYAELKGFQPVVDMQTVKNTYLEDSYVGKVNAWNYYFEPVSPLTVAESLEYENTYVSGENGLPYSPCPSVGWMLNKKKIAQWQRFTHKYLKLNKSAFEYCDRDYQSLINPEDRVLGIKCRGTDYNPISAKGHPIQPPVDLPIKKALQVMKKYKCNKVYLSTEDKNVIEVFKKEFVDKLLVSTSVRVEYNINEKACVSSYSTNREKDKYLQGLEYLRDTYILSKCNCLIGGINGGSAAALVMGSDFEYTYFWYGGRY